MQRRLPVLGCCIQKHLIEPTNYGHRILSSNANGEYGPREIRERKAEQDEAEENLRKKVYGEKWQQVKW